MTPEPRCHLCLNDEQVVPLVPDLDEETPGTWVCGPCWLARNERDNDVQFFLAVIDRQIPPEEKATRTFHHTMKEWFDAVASLRTVREMQSFALGCTRWHSGPGLSFEDAACVTKDNIGFALNTLGWWRRFLWWYAIGVRRSDRFYRPLS